MTRVVQVGTKAKPVAPAPSPKSGGGGGGGSVGGGVDGLNWAALAKCESGGNPRAVNPAGYYGLYQFSLAHLALRRRQRQPDQRVAGGAALPRQAALQARRRRAVGLRARTCSTDRPVGRDTLSG